MGPRDSRYASVRLPGYDAIVRCVVILWPLINPLSRYRYARHGRDGCHGSDPQVRPARPVPRVPPARRVPTRSRPFRLVFFIIRSVYHDRTASASNQATGPVSGIHFTPLYSSMVRSPCVRLGSSVRATLVSLVARRATHLAHPGT